MIAWNNKEMETFYMRKRANLEYRESVTDVKSHSNISGQYSRSSYCDHEDNNTNRSLNREERRIHIDGPNVTVKHMIKVRENMERIAEILFLTIHNRMRKTNKTHSDSSRRSESDSYTSGGKRKRKSRHRHERHRHHHQQHRRERDDSSLESKANIL